jgi:hypothetical protein
MRRQHFGQIVSRQARTVSKSTFGLRGIQSLTEHSTSGASACGAVDRCVWWMLRVDEARDRRYGGFQTRDFRAFSPEPKLKPMSANC